MNANRDGRRKESMHVRLYRAALGCFPERYRDEYTDELLYALRMAAVEAEAQGRVALLRLTWRELRDLPLAILRAHLHERRLQMHLRLGAHLPGGPIRSWRLAVVFLPFLLPLLHPLRFLIFANLTLTMGMVLLAALELLFLALLVVVSFVGLIREFPLWALPAQGLVLFFASAFLQFFALVSVYLTFLLPVYGGWPDGLVEKIWAMFLVQMVYLEFMVAAVAGLLRIVPGFLKQVRQEWTLLSFLLYGIAILPVMGNDEFQGVGRYETASLLVLAAGAGLYLVAPRRWQRVGLLVAAAVLSPAVMSLGLYQTFPVQSWAIPGDVPFQVWEALQPVLYHFPLPILLLLAALAPRLPWNGRREPLSSPAPNVLVQENE